MLQAREKPRADAIRRGFRQMLQARALFEGADISGDRLALGQGAFKAFNQRMVASAQDFHPGGAQLRQQAFESRKGGRIQIRPAFGFHHNQPRGLDGRGRAERAE